MASPRHDAEALAAHVLGVPRSRLALVDGETWVRRSRPSRRPSRGGRRASRCSMWSAARRSAISSCSRPGGADPASGDGAAGRRSPLVAADGRAHGAAHRRSRYRQRRARAGAGRRDAWLAVWAVERDPAALEWAARNVAASRARRSSWSPVTWPMRCPSSTARSTSSSRTRRIFRSSCWTSSSPKCAITTPKPALFAGADALAAIRSVEAAARRLLRPGGLVVVEHGDDQGESAPACFERLARRNRPSRPRRSAPISHGGACR